MVSGAGAPRDFLGILNVFCFSCVHSLGNFDVFFISSC